MVCGTDENKGKSSKLYCDEAAVMYKKVMKFN